MRILFAGSPDIAVPSLEALSEMECRGEGPELAALLTNPDAPRGRRGELLPTEVSRAAENLSGLRREKGLPPITQLKYEKLDARARKEVSALGCDLLITFAYGRIFGPKFLSLFRHGGVNIHPSLLPRYRGPSPINAAILNRDRETGITIQKLALEMDAGDILAREVIPLGPRETAASLSETVSLRAAETLRAFLPRLSAGVVQAEPQQGDPVYCSLLAKEQGRVDWKLPAAEIDARVRAYIPWPLCFTLWEGEELSILEGRPLKENPESGACFPGEGKLPPPAAGSGESAPGLVKGIDRVHGILIQTGDGVFAVSRLQRRGKKALDWKAFLNGARGFIGARLDQQALPRA